MGARTATGIAVILLAAAAAPARADIYTRTDGDGVVHVTNVPEGPGWTLTIEEERPDRPAARPTNAAALRARCAPFVEEASRLYAIPEALIRALIETESSWRATAVSPAGAMGLMQLMPDTARSLGVRDAFDPRDNILGGTRYLRLLANKFAGDIVLTLAAYNAGEGLVARRMAPPYEVTSDYVENVLRRYRAHRER